MTEPDPIDYTNPDVGDEYVSWTPTPCTGEALCPIHLAALKDASRLLDEHGYVAGVPRMADDGKPWDDPPPERSAFHVPLGKGCPCGCENKPERTTWPCVVGHASKTAGCIDCVEISGRTTGREQSHVHVFSGNGWCICGAMGLVRDHYPAEGSCCRVCGDTYRYTGERPSDCRYPDLPHEYEPPGEGREQASTESDGLTDEQVVVGNAAISKAIGDRPRMGREQTSTEEDLLDRLGVRHDRAALAAHVEHLVSDDASRDLS